VSRVRRVGSVKQELVSKSREAALSAVQVFNNPLIMFKSEMFIVNMHIAWTYLLHAHYREKKIEYRYVDHTTPTGRRVFDKTKRGAFKYWALEDCLNSQDSPVEKDASNNLRFLIGLRHEIEHQMTTKIDDALSARFQACCLNYNDLIKLLFGEDYGIDKHLSFSLQFSSLSDEQSSTLQAYSEILPAHISRFVDEFDGSLSEEEYNSPKYAYRVLFTQKTANRPGQADKVIEFIRPDSEIGQNINKTYASIKEKEKTKYRATTIVKIMHDKGYPRFTMYQHTKLWQAHDAKSPTKGYGVDVEGYWYWYEKWVQVVHQFCKSNSRKYRAAQ
jgi:hypothetical protein